MLCIVYCAGSILNCVQSSRKASGKDYAVKVIRKDALRGKEDSMQMRSMSCKSNYFAVFMTELNIPDSRSDSKVYVAT